MGDKSIDHQKAMNLFENLTDCTHVKSPAGRDYLRVEKKEEHSITHYAVEVGRGAGGDISLLLPFANGDLMPMRYVTQRNYANGRTEASMAVTSDKDRNGVVSDVMGLLKDSPNFTIVEISCTKFEPPDADNWRVTIYSQRMSAEEMISLFDKADEKFGKPDESEAPNTVKDVEAFLRSKPS